MQRGAKHGASINIDFYYNNMIHGLKTIVKEEGYRGLFKGVSARVAFHAPMTG